MIFIPGNPPLPETRHSRELGARVEQLVRDYQREHPDATTSDIRAALLRSTPSDSRRRILAIVISALLVGAFTVMASTGGGTRFENNSLAWRLLGGVAAVAAVAIVIIRRAQRG